MCRASSRALSSSFWSPGFGPRRIGLLRRGPATDGGRRVRVLAIARRVAAAVAVLDDRAARRRAGLPILRGRGRGRLRVGPVRRAAQGTAGVRLLALRPSLRNRPSGPTRRSSRGTRTPGPSVRDDRLRAGWQEGAEECALPEISRFAGVSIHMYWLDHGPPHFHVRSAGVECVVDIRTFAITGGRLAPTLRRRVRSFATLRHAELIANWQLARIRRPLRWIDPVP